MNFSEKIKYLRNEKRMSQVELAEAVGVSSRTIQSYEAGKSYPKQREIYRLLSDALECEPNFLMTEDETYSDHQNNGMGMLEHAQELIKELGMVFSSSELTDSDKDAILRGIWDTYWTAKDRSRRKYR